MEPENKDDLINQTEPQTPVLEQPAPPQFENMKKKPSKKRIILLLCLALVVVAAAGTSAYFMLNRKTGTQANEVPSSDTKTAQPVAEPAVFDYQLGSKIFSYNMETKKVETLTTKLPANAQVLDIFHDDQSWRAYYRVIKSGGSEYSVTIWLIEQGKDPVKINTSDSYATFAANAEKKIFAFSKLPNYDPASENVTRTYIIQDRKTTQVWKSKKLELGTETEGHDNGLYNVRGISQDGTKLLFGKSTCYQCDGPLTATAFELDIATGKDSRVFTSKSAGAVSYAQNGKSYLIYENKEFTSVGPQEGPADMTLKELDSLGDDAKLLLDINTTKWNGTGFSQDGSLIYTKKTTVSDEGYAEGTLLTGVYKRTGNTIDSLQKLKLQGIKMSNIGSPFLLTAADNNCYGVIYGSKWNQQESTPIVSSAGVLCLNSENAATFTQIGDSLKQKVPTYNEFYVE